MTEETARRRGVRLGCTRAPRHVLVQRLLVGALAVALVATPGRAAAQDPAIRTTPQGVILNFQDTDIAYVFSALAAAVGMNIVYYDLPQKNVTMRTVQPVSTQDLRNLIQNLAAANQITVIQDGIFLRLQGSGSEDPPDDRRLYIYRLKHARAPILASTLQQLFGGPGTANITQQGRGGLSQRLQQLQQQQQGGRGNAAQAQQ